MTTIAVSSGVTSSVNTHIPATTSYIILGSGTLEVFAGGFISGPVAIEGGGQFDIYASGTAAYAQVDSGGTEIILSNGLLSSSFVGSGGTELVGFILGAKGGISENGIIFGLEQVFDSGQSTNETISNGGTQLLYASGLANDEVASGGTQAVYSSGLALQGAVASYGLMEVYSAGTADKESIYPHGIGDIYSGGTAISSTVFGTQNVYAGGFATSTTATEGGVEQVYSGGAATGTTASSGGTQYVYSGGSTSQTTVSSGGTQLVGSLGLADGTAVASGGAQILTAAGSASDPYIFSGAELYIGAGGTCLSPQVEAGGAEVVFGSDNGASLMGTAAATGTEYDFGYAFGDTVYDDAFQDVALAGAVAQATTIDSGGEQYVGAGASSFNAGVATGGAEVVFGIDSGARLYGTEYDFNVASGDTAFTSGFQAIEPGATAISMTVLASGYQYIGSGGTAIATNVAPQGAQVVFGSALGALVSGTQYDFAYASGGATFGSGEQEVSPNAVATDMTVSSGGYQYIGAGGTAIATIIAAHGAQVVFGSALGALVSGTQYDFAYASGGTTFNGGEQLVAPAGAGTALGMTVSSGGQQYVAGGGTAIGTDVMSQGAEIVHGTDLGATISGTQYVYGLASGTVAAAGGYQVVSAGGAISAAGISGGTIELKNGAVDGSAPITFAGAGELILDASTSFSGTVAGFASASPADSIDFADIPYVATGSTATTAKWVQANNSGTLTVSEASHTAAIVLLGNYAGTFSPSTDGQSGSLVTYAPSGADIGAGPNVLITARQP